MNIASFFKNPIKTFQEEKARKSLTSKIEKILIELFFLYDSKFSMEDLPRFFNTMDTFLKSIQSSEWKIAPKELQELKKAVARDPKGWFRAPDGEQATIENTWLQPTGHWADDFQPRTLVDLTVNGDESLETYGFNGTAKELYSLSAEWFMRRKMNALTRSLQEINKALFENT